MAEGLVVTDLSERCCIGGHRPLYVQLGADADTWTSPGTGEGEGRQIIGMNLLREEGRK
jgi:hypothetical protein